ncbi:MAG TPA: GxxExxY protein [Rhodospirillaceae bacterium]|nr:GxxExxY protein [Rhodospirillaceae bacterium]
MRAAIDPSLDRLTEKIIGGAFVVCHALGHGFLEAVYKNSLCLELAAGGMSATKEKCFPVFYRGEQVGRYVADIVVNDIVIVELKVVEALCAAHAAQVINYLRASGLPVGLLFNFGKPRVEVRRVIL